MAVVVLGMEFLPLPCSSTIPLSVLKETGERPGQGKETVRVE
jgi:hypothetical protein